MKYNVKYPRLPEAQEPLAAIWKANLTLECDPQEKFRWYYQDNPLGAGSAVLLECSSDSGESMGFVGCGGIGNRQFFFHGRPLRVALLSDFAVNREHRTAFPALMLQRSARTYCRAHFDFSYGFPNRHAVGLFHKLGYHDLGQAVRYARVLRHEEYLRRHVGSKGLAKMAGFAIDVPHHSLDLAKSLRSVFSLKLEWLQGVDSRLDRLWERACTLFPLMGYRGSDHVRWRFFDRPGIRHELVALVGRQSNEIRASAVLQLDKVAHVRDLLGQSEEDMGLLLDMLAPELRRRGMSSMSIRFLGSGRMHALLRAHGFVPREQSRSVIMDPGDSSAAIKTDLSNVENWYIMDGDEDS
ncbi:MAG: hypothetical protein HY698_20480 [Deltaproteobacteria bacterium]|nr:hypothetical protein [Deltaproteobacteria bacterium]